jgi:hypothetical protein
MGFSMDGATITRSNMLRLLGLMAMGIGAAWVLQVVGFGPDNSAETRMVWVLAAASIAGAGAGLLVAAGAIIDVDGAPNEA